MKIRGQRVELDEIGITLARHPGIDFGVATSRTSIQGANEIIGYFLPKHRAAAPAVNDLRAHLLKSLPDYMLPSIFVQLESLPLSANGKIDLALLPQAVDAHDLASREAQMPASETEAKLLSIVRELLGGQPVTAADNLFLSGGHSLFGMQLLTRVRTVFGADLTLQQLFESPTVEGLATILTTRFEEGVSGQSSSGSGDPGEPRRHENSLKLITMAGRTAAADLGAASCLSGPCTASALSADSAASPQIIPEDARERRDLDHSSGVLALHAQGTRPRIFWVHNLVVSLAKELGEDQPVCIVMLSSSEIAALGERPDLQTISACLIRKIVAVQPRGPYIIGGLCVGSVLAYEISCQLRAAGHKVELLILLDAPTQPYLKSCTTMATKLGHPLHSLQRVMRIGPGKTLINVGKRLLKYIPLSIRVKLSKSDWDTAHEMIERAAFAYYPSQYEGEVLLLLSEHRVPHLDFLPGWQAVVQRNLHTAYVDGHHREFITPRNVSTVAEIISKHLEPAAEQESVFTTLASSA